MLRLRTVTDATPTAPRGLGRLQLAVALGAGAILLASALFGVLTARGSAHVLASGHGEHLLHEIRRAHPPTGEGLDAAAIAALLERLGPEGLRCLTVFEPDRRLRARAGDCRLPADPGPPLAPPAPGEHDRPSPFDAPPGAPSHPRPGDPVPAGGGRYVMMHALPPAGAPGAPPGPADGPHRYPFVIEYEAPPVAGLRAATAATAAASIVAALVLVGATMWNRRLGARAAALQQALAREQHLAVLGEAAAVLAHELRNPLSSIKGHAQLMVEQLGEDPRAQARAEILVREALRLEDLCEELLDFVRAGRVERVETDPATILRDAARSVDGERIEVRVDDAPARWALDPLRMHQALANLLENAVQAAPRDRSVASARRENDTLVYEVRDHGPGIADDERARIFEPFHTTRLRGTGLGLAVARRVVELHGGRIDVRNHPEGGAVFEVRLPNA